jgi:hypothetical protein
MPGYKAPKFDAHVKLWVRHQRTKPKPESLHNAHVTLWKKEKPAQYFRHRYRTDPEFNAKEKLRARMRKLRHADSDIARLIAISVKAGKWPSKFEAMLGYGIESLVKHLERTIPKGYTMQDFCSGALHIDHIIPRSAFNLNDMSDLRECWSMSNLRLIPAAENRRKSNKVLTLL